MTLSSGTRFRVEAPAKVNLLLRILARRPDGFHELETLFQAVGLTDGLELEVMEGEAYDLEVRGGDVGPKEDNLVTRAVLAFRRATGLSTGLRVVLEKRIPAGAGLGGGSSDAGAALRALNALHGDPLSPGELTSLGAELGADVGFFAGSAALALGEGRGDRLRPLPPLPPRTVVVGLPPAHVATGPAYGALARARAAGLPVPLPLLEGRAPSSWEDVAALAVNDFETVVPRDFPPVAEALEALRGAPCSMAILSGSGAAVFGILDEGADEEGVLASLRARVPGTRWVAAPTLQRLPAPERVERAGRIH